MEPVEFQVYRDVGYQIRSAYQDYNQQELDRTSMALYYANGNLNRTAEHLYYQWADPAALREAAISSFSGGLIGKLLGVTAGKLQTATAKLVDTGIQWGKSIGRQGLPWENYLEKLMPAGSRLPPNFKTFDFFDEKTGIATSAKTLDTNTPTSISNPNQVYSSLKNM